MPKGSDKSWVDKLYDKEFMILTTILKSRRTSIRKCKTYPSFEDQLQVILRDKIMGVKLICILNQINSNKSSQSFKSKNKITWS